MELRASPLFIITLFSLLVSISSTNIRLGSTLYASNLNQSWSSPNNTFSLSFIRETANSFIPTITYSGGVSVWTAGKTPVDSSGSFHFLPTGTLRLINGSGATVWDSSTEHLNVSSAALDDSGNLVLLRKDSTTVWSTFDNPTDTVLPSQNFTYGKTLRSGVYSFTLLKSGNLRLRWNDSTVYWNQGLNSSINSTLTWPILTMQPIGLLSVSDTTLPTAVIVAYSSDYAEGTDVLRFLSYNDSSWDPICKCPSQNFEPIDARDSRKGCKRKVEIENCSGNATMLELAHTKFLTFQPELSSQAFFVGITACRLNCLVAGSCVASTSLSDGTGLCYLKTPGFVSGYQNAAVPSTSFVKVCGPVLPNP
ncbi:G-type lectin S-receptor-like serine/threonine-protein kinase [Melia azedarach]|uniref:G-type lectin S-receptor-like serine/threonine-protein kinase n=1 Tax=Melia azedarach TaxID=155640 RepID=A0ACC1WQD7_MELAZ|nr:G-type lectin S-receptor-like serine/threonine-protein kinase [Melia azedarach]